jgi:hypothetical protein
MNRSFHVLSLCLASTTLVLGSGSAIAGTEFQPPVTGNDDQMPVGGEQHSPPLVCASRSVNKTAGVGLYAVVENGPLTSTYDGEQLRPFSLLVEGGGQGFELTGGLDYVKEYAAQGLDFVKGKLSDAAASKAAEFAGKLQQQVTDLAFKVESNREKKRAEITAGGWFAVWGTEYDDKEYFKTGLAAAASVATENPGPLAAYFEDLISRNVDLLVEQFPEIGKEAMQEYFNKALMSPGSNIGVRIANAVTNTGIDVKLGIAEYETKATILGTGSTEWLPHYQPYLAFRFTVPGTNDVIEPDGSVLGPPPVISGDQPVSLDLFAQVLVNKDKWAKSVLFRWGPGYAWESYTMAPGEIKALAQRPIGFDPRGAVSPQAIISYRVKTDAGWRGSTEQVPLGGGPRVVKSYNFSLHNDGRVLNAPQGSTILNPFAPQLLATEVTAHDHGIGLLMPVYEI